MPSKPKLIDIGINIQVLFDKIEEFGILLLDENGKVLDCNVGARKITGFGNSDFIGKSPEFLFVQQNRKFLLQHNLQLALNEGKVVYESALLRKDGHEFWANISISLADPNSSANPYFLMVIHDNSDFVEAERKIRSLAKFPEENPYPVLRLAFDGEVLFSNDAGKQFLDLWEVKNNYVKSQKIMPFIKIALDEAKSLSKEITLRNKTYLFAIVPIRNYTNMYAVDITEMKQAREALLASKELAEQSDRLKSEFLAQMSHEIRTPVNVILSYLSLLRDETNADTSEGLNQIFGAINSGSKRLIRTIDLILNLSQVQTGAYQLQLVEIDISKQVLLPLMKEFAPIANEKGLEILFENNLESGKFVADLYSVNQIFTNLLDNALKFTLNGTVTIKAYDDEKFIKIAVCDTGRGISREYMPKLFEEFSQEETGYTRSFDGNGLGLTLVKKYCELHNADIDVKSEKNVGSEFTVFFPKQN